MSKTKVAIIILNWNGRNYLERFLPALTSFSEAAEIVIADNFSSDDSIAFLKSNYPQLRRILLNENYGFAGGYNMALKEVDADVFVLLNSDVEVTAGWIEPIISLMEEDTTIVACQPKIRSYNDKPLLEHAGGAGGFIDYLGYPFCRGRIYNALEEDHGQYNDSREVFWATGACLFVRANIFHQLKGFDEDFFAHMEEIDLCWRIHRLGYKIMVEPKSEVFHVGGGTLPKNNPRKTYYNFRNNLMMIHKNQPAPKVWWILIARLFLDGLAGIKFLVDGDFRDCLAVIKAHFYFYKNFKKRQVIRNQFVPDKSQIIPCIYQNSIVLSHYAFGKKKFSSLDQSKFSGK